MTGFSCDGSGILVFRDENQRVLFDRVVGTVVAGWSNHASIQGKFKNVNESTGKADTKDR